MVLNLPIYLHAIRQTVSALIAMKKILPTPYSTDPASVTVKLLFRGVVVVQPTHVAAVLPKFLSTFVALTTNRLVF